MKHALWSPSKLVYSEKCPGFLSGPAGEAAERGTKIDAFVTAMLNGEVISDEPPADLVEGIEWAVEQHTTLAAEVDGDLETQVRVQTSLPGVFGFLDVRAVNLFDGVAYIGDTKSGRGDRGSPAHSPQLMLYAEGTLREFPSLERFVLAFVEVDKRRAIRSEVTAEQVRAYLPGAANIIEAAKRDDPETYSPGRHCGYCVKAVTCPRVGEDALAPVAAGVVAPMDAHQLRPDDVGAFLDAWKSRIEFASEILGAVEARARALYEVGCPVPGWDYVPGRKVRKWADQGEAAQVLRGVLGDAAFETSLKSPAQCEKVKVSGADIKALVSSLTKVSYSLALTKVEETTALPAGEVAA